MTLALDGEPERLNERGKKTDSDSQGNRNVGIGHGSGNGYPRSQSTGCGGTHYMLSHGAEPGTSMKGINHVGRRNQVIRVVDVSSVQCRDRSPSLGHKPLALKGRLEADNLPYCIRCWSLT